MRLSRQVAAGAVCAASIEFLASLACTRRSVLTPHCGVTRLSLCIHTYVYVHTHTVLALSTPVSSCVPCRRGKRLRKILRQLESPLARGPLTRFWRGTWGVVATLLLAHIVCYAVLASILTVRHQ